MTYITPDDVALQAEAKRYAARHPMPQGPAFIGGRGFRGEVIPLLAAAPIPPLDLKVTKSWKTTNPAPRAPFVTTSPYDQDHQDPLPGMFLSGLGEWTVPAKYVGGLAAIGALWWFMRRRR